MFFKTLETSHLPTHETLRASEIFFPEINHVKKLMPTLIRG